MTLPEPRLDDRDFPSLIAESRRRIAQRCPEWTEHNVSDPGITLIELFAWMTDQLIYRVNRIPEKLEVALLNLLGVRLVPPAPARTRLRFMFAGDRKPPNTIPAGTEVATRRTGDAEPIVFATTQARTVGKVALAGAAVLRAGQGTTLPVSDDGFARPVSTARAIFANPPKPNDALYIGSRSALGNLVLDLRVKCGPARGLGIDPDEPPWQWEAWGRNRSWHPVTVVSDTTGGFNTRGGVVRLEVEVETAVGVVGGQSLHWLRCRPGPPPSSESHGYAAPPEIEEMSLTAVGVNLPAEHFREAAAEVLGFSDGTTGQSFRLTRSPVLALRESDEIQVNAADHADEAAWETWTQVASFADSGALDHHVVFDAAEGEVRFGPAVRVPGGWRQHGAVPPAGSKIRITGYRHGGGTRGNLPAEKLTVLREAIPGVAKVGNPAPASGGVDAESVAQAKLRAPRELRTGGRAVTAGDFELLAQQVPRVARARCLRGADDQAVAVHVLPAVGQAPGVRAPEESVAPADVLEEVKRKLEARALLGTSVHVTPAKLRVVTCAVEVLGDGRRDAKEVKLEIEAELSQYLDPYIGGNPSEDIEGWPWGRNLHRGELMPIVRRVPGVRRVDLLRVYESEVGTPQPAGPRVEDVIKLAPNELVVSGRHRVRVNVGR